MVFEFVSAVFENQVKVTSYACTEDINVRIVVFLRYYLWNYEICTVILLELPNGKMRNKRMAKYTVYSE